MSAKSVERILFRAVAEPEYRRRLFADSHSALQGYDLTADETESLSRLTPAAFHGMIGGLVAHRLLPLRVGGRFVVGVPSVIGGAKGDDVPIRIGPGWAFGNGSHPTTGLALALIDHFLRPDDSMLDVGTGSGILAIAAARLGASAVLALDIDSEAVEAATENVRLNGVESLVRVGRGSVDASSGGWAVVAANIVWPVVCALLGQGLREAVRPGGVLITSAIKAKESQAAELQLQSAGFEIVERATEGGWVAVAAKCSLVTDQ